MKRGGRNIVRNSFIQLSKLSNVKGRIDYITNPEKQENLYATYETIQRSFWKSLAVENQQDFQKSMCWSKRIDNCLAWKFYNISAWKIIENIYREIYFVMNMEKE